MRMRRFTSLGRPRERRRSARLNPTALRRSGGCTPATVPSRRVHFGNRASRQVHFGNRASRQVHLGNRAGRQVHSDDRVAPAVSGTV